MVSVDACVNNEKIKELVCVHTSILQSFHPKGHSKQVDKF